MLNGVASSPVAQESSELEELLPLLLAELLALAELEALPLAELLVLAELETFPLLLLELALAEPEALPPLLLADALTLTELEEPEELEEPPLSKSATIRSATLVNPN